MSRALAFKSGLLALGLLSAPLALQGCAVGSVAGATVGVAATGVGAATKVAGAAVGLTADTVGAAGKAVTGGK